MITRKQDKALAVTVATMRHGSVGDFENASEKYVRLLTQEQLPKDVGDHLRSVILCIRRARIKAEPADSATIEEAIAAATEAGFLTLGGKLLRVFAGELGGSVEPVPHRLLPTSRDVSWWIKEAGLKKAQVLQTVLAAPDVYFQSALADWAFENAPLPRLTGWLEMALSGIARKEHLRSNVDLVAAVVRRDKKAVSAKIITPLACVSRAASQTYLAAIYAVGDAWGPWAVAVSPYLAPDSPLLWGVLEDVASSHERRSRFMSVFLAHAISARELTALARRGSDAAHMSSSASSSVFGEALKCITRRGMGDRWIAGPMLAIAEALARDSGKVSVHGAMLVAQGMRAISGGTPAAEAFQAVAMNLGLEKLGQAGESVVFDQAIHEDVSGGLLPGESAVISAVGWLFDGGIIMRAKVVARANG